MKKFILNPNISVGPFVFGMEREEVWKMMKDKFGTERELPTFEREYYTNPNVLLEYIDNKLVSVSFVDDRYRRYCEIYLNGEKIWPRTQKKFFSIFGEHSFVDVYGEYMSSELSIATEWELDGRHNLLLAITGYSKEMIECFQFFGIILELKKGMERDKVRKLIGRTPKISNDGRTDCYPQGFYSPEETFITYDANNRLVKITKKYYIKGKTQSVLE